MDDPATIWCKKSARKPPDQPLDPRGQRGRYLHEYWDEEGHVLRCYIDHDGECDWGMPTTPLLAPHLKWI